MEDKGGIEGGGGGGMEERGATLEGEGDPSTQAPSESLFSCGS